MKLYFLVEGKCDDRFYKVLLDYFFEKKLKKVGQCHIAQKNNYFMFSGRGLPKIFERIKPCIEDANEYSYDHLFICIDAESNTLEEKRNEVNSWIQELDNKKNISFKGKLHIIIQNKCLGTWYLGNQNICQKTITDPDLIPFNNFYDLRVKDPEMMEKPTSHKDSIANYHLKYLQKLLDVHPAYKAFGKYKLYELLNQPYIDAMVARTESGHLQTFFNLYTVFNKIKQDLK